MDRQWFLKMSPIPCSDSHNRIMCVFNAMLPEGLNITGIQYVFFALSPCANIYPDSLNLFLTLWTANNGKLFTILHWWTLFRNDATMSGPSLCTEWWTSAHHEKLCLPKMVFLDPVKLLTCCQLSYLFAKLSTRRCLSVTLSVTFTFLGFCCPVLLVLKLVAAVKFKMRSFFPWNN